MSANAIDALQTVREFLAEKLLAAVPPGMKSDVRAAAKLIENALAELNAAYPTLTAECQAMAQLFAVASTINDDDALRRIAASAEALASNMPDATWKLHDLSTCHAAWCALTGDLALALHRNAGATAAALLLRLLDTLGKHASTRAAWQSVFPTTQQFSGILIETDTR